MSLRSQVTFVIEELKISNITPNLIDETFEEDEYDGPYVFFKCLLINENDSSICIFPSKSIIKVTFNYMNENYTTEVIAIPFVDHDKLILNHKDSIPIFFGLHLFLGTPLWSEYKNDYRMTLLGSIPTLIVEYVDPNLKFYSSRIKRVIL